ncbi:MAG: molecular chaperone HtpG [Methylobacteriaceae bacterium]|nr:molecular chaperone HtpG [Methylobacteriaceae bacterium]
MAISAESDLSIARGEHKVDANVEAAKPETQPEGQARQPENHEFQADVSRLLHLMVHSVYSDRDIFLRELISNGADACEKLRHEALTNPELTGDAAAFEITIGLDKNKRLLSVEDNGIGMSREELSTALGTIASSGTRAFLEKLGGDEKPAIAADLIGQFGIGFYSVFMVADKVEVDTRRAGSDEAWRWTSDGRGTYAIEPLLLADAPARGTRVRLHMMEDATEYLQSWKVQSIVREYSSGIAVPIALVEAPQKDGKDAKEEESKEPKRISEGSALWARPKDKIEESEYTEFYRSHAGQFDEPLLTIHWRAEGRHEYTVLAFIPGSRPLDLFDPARKGRNKLYVRRVLISRDTDLLPGWLRFVRLVVDSADLPLNVSREMVQKSPVFGAIGKAVTNRILQEITKLAEKEPEKFAKLWENFGAVLKEGLYEDSERRDQLFEIACFATSSDPEGKRTLKEYVASLRPNQTAIYYLTGEDAKRLASSPQLEGFRARGIEVLLLSDPVDTFWVSTAVGYDGKPFKSVTQGAADISSIPLEEGQEAPAAGDVKPEVATLLALMKQTIGEVEDVRASERLSDSPVCLIAPEHGPDRRLARILAEHGKLGDMPKPVLEVNPRHALIESLARHINDSDKTWLEDTFWLLYEMARVSDGESPSDPAGFAGRLTRALTKLAA